MRNSLRRKWVGKYLGESTMCAHATLAFQLYPYEHI